MPLYSSTLGMVVVVPGTRWTQSVPRPGKQVILHLRVGELQEHYEHIWDHGVSPPVRVLGRGAQMEHAGRQLIKVIRANLLLAILEAEARRLGEVPSGTG